ncbi:hypothetical protein ACO2FA_13405 [Staphylococcus warneri]
MDRLPQNKMRIITLQQSDAMNEIMVQKTRATVFGIALVAMFHFEGFGNYGVRPA